jgi:hypothetical protein
MSRTLTVALTVTAALGAAMALPAVAYAEVSAANCTTTYANAETSNALVNGPVHGGGTSGGDFTPATLLNGATAPTSAYVVCMV